MLVVMAVTWARSEVFSQIRKFWFVSESCSFNIFNYRSGCFGVSPMYEPTLV